MRLTVLAKFSTVQSGVKVPSNFMIICCLNLSSATFISVNVKKKGISLIVYQVMSINLDDRIRNEVIRTPSIRHFGGQLWAGQVGLLDILQSKDNWNFLISIS